jgi:hypothetical protein
MKTLKDLAGLYRSLAQTNMLSGPWRPVYKTGNLYNRIGSYNSVNQMLTEISQNKYTLTLNFAPPGATYGYFAETGTGTHSRIGPRPFAEMAANSTQLSMAINEFMDGKVEEAVQTMGNRVDVAFSKLFQKK